MKIWNLLKNLMLTLSITMLYAIWSSKKLHEVSTIRMWVILIAVACIIFCLIRAVDG